MENELLLETFAYGVGHGIFYFLTTGILITTFDLIYETALEKKDKRKTLIGKLDARTYHIIESSFNRIDKNNDIEISQLDFAQFGHLVYLYMKIKKIDKERKKEFWNKLKFWKRG